MFLSISMKMSKLKFWLIFVGRVDNRQTDRQARISSELQMGKQKLKQKNTLIRTKQELIAEWDRYWGLAQYHWDDNHLKLQRKKLGKVVDPKYRPPDIDIKALRGKSPI